MASMGIGQPDGLYRLLARNIPNSSIFLLDRDLRYVLVDGPELQRRGFTPDMFLGKTLREAVPSDVADVYEPIVRQALAGRTNEGEIEFMGQVYWTQAVPVHDAQGEVGSCLILSMNITERKKAQTAEIEIARLRAALDKEHDLNNLRAKMLVRIAHEFRNPLAVILTSTYLLQQYARRMSLSDQLVHFARIEERVRHMAHLLDELSSAVQPEAGTFDPQPFDLDALVQEVIDALPQSIRAVYTREGDLSTVRHDRKLLRIILNHLLSNALKFSLLGHSVMLHIAHASDHLILTVRDNGVGILPAEMPRIFEPFFRGSNFGELPGLGIGLTQVQNAVHLAGGDIHVDSQPNAGATFTVTLPVTA